MPIIDLKSGYVLRSVDALPKQGARAPWRLYQNYPRDVLLMRHGRLSDEGACRHPSGSRTAGVADRNGRAPERPAGTPVG